MRAVPQAETIVHHASTGKKDRLQSQQAACARSRNRLCNQTWLQGCDGLLSSSLARISTVLERLYWLDSNWRSSRHKVPISRHPSECTPFIRRSRELVKPKLEMASSDSFPTVGPNQSGSFRQRTSENTFRGRQLVKASVLHCMQAGWSKRLALWSIWRQLRLSYWLEKDVSKCRVEIQEVRRSNSMEKDMRISKIKSSQKKRHFVNKINVLKLNVNVK